MPLRVSQIGNINEELLFVLFVTLCIINISFIARCICMPHVTCAYHMKVSFPGQPVLYSMYGSRPLSNTTVCCYEVEYASARDGKTCVAPRIGVKSVTPRKLPVLRTTTEAYRCRTANVLWHGIPSYEPCLTPHKLSCKSINLYLDLSLSMDDM
jgi:hypothetical protein